MNMYKRCSAFCTNWIKNDGKTLLKAHVPHDPAALYIRAERLNAKCQNIQMHSLGDPSTKYSYDFQHGSEIHELKANVPNISDGFITKQDKENVNDELLPLTFVAFLPVSETEEPNEGHEDDTMVLDSVLKDPFGEYSSFLDITEERHVTKECSLLSELQEMNEPKEDNDVSDLEMTDGVFHNDKQTHSYHEMKGTKCKLSLSCDQKNDMESYRDVIFSDTFCSERCACEEMHALEIKFESTCEISGADVKKERVFETGHCWYHTLNVDIGTSPMEPKSVSLKSDVQHFTSIDNQQDVNA